MVWDDLGFTQMDTKLLIEKAKLVRKWCLVSTTEAGSGHPTSCLSAADIGTVLFGKYFTYDIKDPENPTNDRFVLSKGHAAPLLYTLFALSGAFNPQELLTLRKFGSRLEGHPASHFPYAEAATGSLGQGLSVGAGMAYAGKNEKLSFTTYVLLGDGELAEGQVWEAANFASYYKLDNLVAILDINRLAQSQETMFGHQVREYMDRFRAFGFEVIEIDGHDIAEIDAALKAAQENKTGKPYAIVAKTLKGKGVSFLADKEGWHGKPLKKDDLERALIELGNVDDNLRFALRKPKLVKAGRRAQKGKTKLSQYALGDEKPTREVYGEILANLGTIDPDVYSLDGDVKNSTFSQDFLKAHPERFIECFIAEQNMVSVAVGLSRLGKKPFVSTFAAFLTRASDQIRMAAISRANISFCGSHAGVSIGEDGPSQMGLEDIAMFGTIPESTILHPCDAVSTIVAVHHLHRLSGISYLRTLRSPTPVIYDADEAFPVGGSKVLRSSPDDVLTIVAAGITVHEALKAHAKLAEKGIHVRVVDCYSIKPIDKNELHKSLMMTKKPVIITVEDHFLHGGLGDFVFDAVATEMACVEKMAVTHISRSGSKDELLEDAGISASHIVKKVLSLSKGK